MLSHYWPNEIRVNGTFEATVNGFVEILKNSKNPLQDAKDILSGLEKQRKTQDLSKVPHGDKIEIFLERNKLKIAIGIAILKVFINLLAKQPNIEINNNILNQQFYNQYNQIINIDLDKEKNLPPSSAEPSNPPKTD